jgi:predicted nucleic acid-binding protein
MLEGRAFVDTNVLVYAIDRAEPAKREVARTVLAERATDLVVSAQVLSEFYAVTTGRLGEPLRPETAAALVDDFAQLPTVVVDAELVREGIEISRTTQIAYWDGLIVAAARAGRCASLLTEDLQSGATIAGVRIENPFLA